MFRFVSVKVAQKLLLLAFGFLLAGAFVEISVRIWKRDIAFQPDPELIRSLRPDVSRKIYSYETKENLNSLSVDIPSSPVYQGMDYTNNIGLRMSEEVLEKKNDEKRILLLGDSYAEAEGVADNERFYYLVNQKLRRQAHAGEHWRIINAAIQNGAPSQYILQIRKYMDLVRPDVVIVCLAPNDLMDDLNFERTNGYVFDNQGIPVSPRDAARLWLLQKLWSLRYFEVVTSRSMPRLHTSLFPVVSPAVKVPDWKPLVYGNDDSLHEEYLRKTGHYLLYLKSFSEAHHAAFGVFLIHYMWAFPNEPYYLPKYPTLKQEMSPYNPIQNVVYYNHFIDDFLGENRIAYVNPYETMLSAKASHPMQKLWCFYDYHFSPAGHQLVANQMLAFLLSNFVPEH